ncbi:MAG TPA: cytochrome b/b6 domain-containing protein [Steroidobacteraceae bacterium]|nr:cytochrome b/b6 domain-containing protein [Steroidobacteraceae bacterium]
MKTNQNEQVDYRHPLPVRLWHWANAAAVLVLLLTGLLIFDIHPHLYWGEAGQEGEGAFVSFSGQHLDQKVPRTELQIGSGRWNTTGKLGSTLEDGFGGRYLLVASPPEDWQFGATRGWHFAFAWLLGLSLPLYAVYLLASRRLDRTLLPTRGELRPRSMAHELWEHLRLRRARGEAARHYNSLQKLTYLLVIFVLIPGMVLSGLAMSNTLSAAWPALSELFGGHQTARSIHFITAMLLVAFVLVHVFQVFVAGFVNLMRSMITGRFVVERESAP